MAATSEDFAAKVAVEPVSMRELKIKTGVVRRTGKELSAYEKEHIKQQARIDKLIADKADDADVRKQREVLAETTQMLPDTRIRLTAARKELADALATLEATAEQEEVIVARETMQETAAAVASC